MNAETEAPPVNTARLTSSPGAAWEVFGTFTSQPLPPMALGPARPMRVTVSTFNDADASDDEVLAGVRRRDDVIGLEVGFADFLWHGPAGFHSSQVFALEVWTPLPIEPALERPADDEDLVNVPGVQEWIVLWVPTVRVKMMSTVYGAPPEIAFTTDGVPRGLGALAPASPAVPDENRGRPVQYLCTQYKTTEGPPAVVS